MHYEEHAMFAVRATNFVQNKAAFFVLLVSCAVLAQPVPRDDDFLRNAAALSLLLVDTAFVIAVVFAAYHEYKASRKCTPKHWMTSAYQSEPEDEESDED